MILVARNYSGAGYSHWALALVIELRRTVSRVYIADDFAKGGYAYSDTVMGRPGNYYVEINDIIREDAIAEDLSWANYLIQCAEADILALEREIAKRRVELKNRLENWE
jgi:hypothetical protein